MGTRSTRFNRWGAPPPIDSEAIALTTHGDVVFRAAAVLARLAPGVAGQFLQTPGPAANPLWADVLVHDHYARYLWDGFSHIEGDFASIVPDQYRVYLAHLEVPFNVTTDRLIYMQRFVAAGNFNMGIYRDNGDTPVGGALVVNLGPTAVAAGASQKKETAAAAILTAGLYWFCYVQDSATATVIRRMNNPFISAGGTLNTYYYDLPATLVLTDPCPAVTEIAWNPVMGVRVASAP